MGNSEASNAAASCGIGANIINIILPESTPVSSELNGHSAIQFLLWLAGMTGSSIEVALTAS